MRLRVDCGPVANVNGDDAELGPVDIEDDPPVPHAESPQASEWARQSLARCGWLIECRKTFQVRDDMSGDSVIELAESFRGTW